MLIRRASRIVPRTHRYLVKKGIVGRRGQIVSAGSYFGEDIILNDSYVRNYGVMSLSYLDVFRLDREALIEQLQFNKFPRFSVRPCGVQ